MSKLDQPVEEWGSTWYPIVFLGREDLENANVNTDDLTEAQIADFAELVKEYLQEYFAMCVQEALAHEDFKDFKYRDEEDEED